jgi:hypothetical protein
LTPIATDLVIEVEIVVLQSSQLKKLQKAGGWIAQKLILTIFSDCYILSIKVPQTIEVDKYCRVFLFAKIKYPGHTFTWCAYSLKHPKFAG